MRSQTWAFDLTDRHRRIRKRTIRIEKQLTEFTDDRCAHRHVLVIGRYTDQEQEEVMLKIRYDIRTDRPDKADLEAARKRADNEYFWEIDAVVSVGEFGHGPKYLDHVSQRAGEMFPCPDSRVHFIIMSTVKGQNVTEIYRQLSFNQLESIRVQLAKIFEHLRQEDKLLYSQDLNNLRYDIDEDKLYFIDFTFLKYIDHTTEMRDPMTPNNIFVLAHNLWSKEHLKKAKMAARKEAEKQESRKRPMRSLRSNTRITETGAESRFSEEDMEYSNKRPRRD